MNSLLFAALLPGTVPARGDQSQDLEFIMDILIHT
jgi:hypothetical protein